MNAMPDLNDYPDPTETEVAQLANRLGVDLVRARETARKIPAALGIPPRPGSGSDVLANRIVEDYLLPEATVATFYGRLAPGFAAAYQVFAELPELVHIAQRAIEADRTDNPDDGGGPWLILTTRPGDRFSLRQPYVSADAVRLSRQDIACDLNMGGNGYCVLELESIKRNNLSYADKHGAMMNQGFTFPLMYEDYVILSRICFDCWLEFVKKNKITNVRIQKPWEFFG